MPDQRRVVLKMMEWPEPAKDVDELLRGFGPEAFQHAIDTAKPVHAWMIDHLEDRYAIDTPEGKDAAVVDMVEMLAKLPPFERMARTRELAAKLGVPLPDVRQAINECYLERHGRRMPHPAIDIPRLD